MRLDGVLKRVVYVSCIVCFAMRGEGAEQVTENVKVGVKVKVGDGMLYPEVRKYVEARGTEFDRIPGERKELLRKLAAYVESRNKKGEPARLTFICTHNSRRSQISQIWCGVAAAHYGVEGVETFSGGTEGTAFNPRAVAAMERSGLKVTKKDESSNPRYEVRYCEEGKPLVCFSKVYDEAPNPKQDYCAVMTCSQADESCPNVPGCALRVALQYEDPKVADDTPEEAARYDERSAQICREMLYLFSVARGE